MRQEGEKKGIESKYMIVTKLERNVGSTANPSFAAELPNGRT